METKATVKIAEYIRASSRQGKLVRIEELTKGPLNIEAPKLEKMLEEIASAEEFADILRAGEDNQLFYSSAEMSENYAEVLLNLESKNLLKTIADFVRKESKIYPRPTPMHLFTLTPFKASGEELHDAVAAMENSEDYKDIGTVSASNGAVYLFSELHMTRPHARGLCQWLEVDQFDNP